jgi:SAM-dependent methyltransferase
MLEPGRKGLGFGVGNEPLASLFAQSGISVLATDLDPVKAQATGWISSQQYAANKASLNSQQLCDPLEFDRLVDFRFMDMNSIDADLSGRFDFCWSACALEHLGSIEHGLKFIENSIDCLRPGGIAVHTTEYNCSSNWSTLNDKGCVIFRRRDIERLARRLTRKGHRLALNFELGDQPADQIVDVPPYTENPHLKLQIARWTSTSFGILIRKAAAE